MSGLGSKTGALGEGSVGGSSGRGQESKAGGREQNDSASSLSGDTSSEPNVNNEAPMTGKEGATFDTDSTSAKLGSDGAAGSNAAEINKET